jgi:hypothetical protein
MLLTVHDRPAGIGWCDWGLLQQVATDLHHMLAQVAVGPKTTCTDTAANLQALG